MHRYGGHHVKSSSSSITGVVLFLMVVVITFYLGIESYTSLKSIVTSHNTKVFSQYQQILKEE